MRDLSKFYINGQWVTPHSNNKLAVINPANEEVCATITLGDEVDTNNAVSAARNAFAEWSKSSINTRIEYLEKILEIYLRRSEEIALAITTEMGAPINLSRKSQMPAGSGHIASTIKALKNYQFSSIFGDPELGQQVIKEAYGVVALITPWNWPMNQVTLKVAPAIAAGCTMILKPSEIAPLSSMIMAEIIDEAGLPDGVFNLVNGDGAGVGTMLSAHSDIDMVSFTGSTRAGRLITKSAAESVKRVTLELGGKGANIIFADADEKAVKRGVRHCFNNSGQSCNAPTRMLVERSYYQTAIAEAEAAAKEASVGDPMQEGRHIGPVVSELQFNKIQALIQAGIDEGARLLVGGTGLPDNVSSGYFVKPTVFVDVHPSMTIAREEIFGPVLSIIPFDTEEDAVEQTNNTSYGLTNYIQTSEKQKAMRIANLVRSGTVEINGKFIETGMPFGGYKQSGNGREGGAWGMDEFLETKAVSAF